MSSLDHEQLREARERAQVWQEMNYTAANLAFAQDPKLFILFHQYLDALPDSDRAPQIE